MNLLNCVGYVDCIGGSKGCVGRVGHVDLKNFGMCLKFYERQNVDAKT